MAKTFRTFSKSTFREYYSNVIIMFIYVSLFPKIKQCIVPGCCLEYDCYFLIHNQTYMYKMCKARRGKHTRQCLLHSQILEAWSLTGARDSVNRRQCLACLFPTWPYTSCPNTWCMGIRCSSKILNGSFDSELKKLKEILGIP